MTKLEPISVGKFGVKYIGGVKKIDAEGQTRISEQSYVRYIIPSELKYSTPVVMLPGFGLNASIYEETHDGREGWAQKFLREGYAVYIMDEPYSGPSGFDTVPLMKVRDGELSTKFIPSFVKWGIEQSFIRWGFGPEVGVPYEDSKFSIEHLDTFYKMIVPVCIDERFDGLGSPMKAERIIDLLIDIGPAIVLSHSGSGLSCFDAVKLAPDMFEAIITVEPVKVPTGEEEIKANYLNQRILGVFGDHREERSQAGADMVGKFNDLNNLIKVVNEENGIAEMIDLPAIGITGNSHVMMLDSNNQEIADLILNWIKKWR